MNHRTVYKNSKTTNTFLITISLLFSAIISGFFVSISASPLTSIHPLANFLWIIAPIGLLAFFWFTQNPNKFIILVVVLIPFEEFIIKWLPLDFQRYARYIIEILIVAIFISTVLQYWHKRGFIWPKNILNIPLATFLILSFLSAILYDVPLFIYALSLKNLIRYAFLYYIISFINLPLSYVKKLTLLIIIVAVLQALLGISEELIGLPMSYFLKSSNTGFTTLTGISNPLALWAKAKPSGTIGLYSSYGVFLVFWAIFTFTKFLIAPTKNKRYMVLFFILSLGILVSRARTSWILLIIGMILSLFFLRRYWLLNGSLFTVSIILATLLFLGSINIFGPQGPQLTGLDTLIVSTSGDITTYRAETVLERLGEILTLKYWQKASRVVTLTITLPEILKHYPFLGVGPGTMGSEITGGGSTSPGIYPQYSHQSWLDVPENIIIWTADTGFVAMIAQFGILGILPWGIFLLLLFRISWNLFKQTNDSFIFWFSTGMIINIILFFLSEFVGHYITYRAYGLYFWVWAGFIVNIRRFEDKSIIKETPTTID